MKVKTRVSVPISRCKHGSAVIADDESLVKDAKLYTFTTLGHLMTYLKDKRLAVTWVDESIAPVHKDLMRSSAVSGNRGRSAIVEAGQRPIACKRCGEGHQFGDCDKPEHWSWVCKICKVDGKHITYTLGYMSKDSPYHLTC